MGGRGTDLEPSGKALKAIRITLDNGRVLSYRTHENGRVTDIDNFGDEKNINGLSLSQMPHTHLGYVHEEHGSRLPNKREQKMIDRVWNVWQNRTKPH